MYVYVCFGLGLEERGLENPREFTKGSLYAEFCLNSSGIFSVLNVLWDCNYLIPWIIVSESKDIGSQEVHSYI